MQPFRHIYLVLPIVAALCGGCNLSRTPEPTATISSDQVLLTAQAIAQQTLEASTPTITKTSVPPTDTVPAETLTPTETPTPTSPIVTADYNSNVRAGPGEEYEIIDFLLIGQTANVAGRNEVGNRNLVVYPSHRRGEGWLDLGRRGHTQWKRRGCSSPRTASDFDSFPRTNRQAGAI